MRTNVIIIISLFCGSILQGQSIDSEKSMVTFEVGNLKVRKVEGTFQNMQGSVNFNPNDLANSTFEVCIDASTINTGNKKRDAHLRDEDFFDVDNYPEICFKSESIVKSMDGYITKGRLTMHGVTKTVEIQFQFSGNKFTGTLSLNRLDYNVGTETGTFMVSDEVMVRIDCLIQ